MTQMEHPDAKTHFPGDERSFSEFSCKGIVVTESGSSRPMDAVQLILRSGTALGGMLASSARRQR